MVLIFKGEVLYFYQRCKISLLRYYHCRFYAFFNVFWWQ